MSESSGEKKRSQSPPKDELFQLSQQGLCEGVAAFWELNFGRIANLDGVTGEGRSDKISSSLLGRYNYVMVTRLSILLRGNSDGSQLLLQPLFRCQ